MKSCSNCEHKGYDGSHPNTIEVCRILGYGIPIREVREKTKLCGLAAKWFEQKIERDFWGRPK